MDTISAIETRRAVKHFDPAHKISNFEIEKLLSLAMLSPTAFNIQHWRFVVVRDVEQRQKLRAAAWNQAQVTDASLLVILCADLRAWEKEPSRYWRKAPKEVQDILLPAISQYYVGNEQRQRDEVMRSCGIAGQTLMLAAKSMGYDSCPMDGFDYREVGKIINLPEHHVISFMVAIGKSLREPWERPGQLSMEEVVIKDQF